MTPAPGRYLCILIFAWRTLRVRERLRVFFAHVVILVIFFIVIVFISLTVILVILETVSVDSRGSTEA